MLRSTVLVVALVSTGQAALAQQPVGAGGQLQQIPPAAIQARPAPGFDVRRDDRAAEAAPAGPKIRVQSLHVTGQTLFSEAELIAATSFTPGSELDLSGLRALASQITAFYNSRGYFLAQAYVPEQNSQSGRITIAVIEGRFGKIALNNQANLSDRVASGVIAGMDSGDIVATAPLERRLLLLSDIPGVRVRSTLSPGAAVGTSDLLVDLTPDRRVTGSIEADNAGSRYTGAYRVGGTVNLNNPTGNGDLLSLRVLTSFSGLAYGRASYQAPVGKATVGAAYTHIDYDLGREFKSLDGSGNAEVASLYASYPLVRSRDSNLYLLAGADAKWFEDKLGFLPAVSHRRTQVLTLGLSGDEHDGFGGGGWSAYSAGLSLGNLDIRSAVDRAADAATARSDGGYGKLQLSLARLQTVSGPLSVYGAIRGQIAFDNLDISEKMELGGAYAVRAYPEGEAYGDQGYVATVEARLLLPKFTEAVPGDFQLFGFIDAGEVDYAKNPWFAGSNHAKRSGYGAGLSWAAAGNFIVKAAYARKLGNADATSAPDRAGRAWFQISKNF
ncbi:MAG: Polypeptide-transport-associated domain protein ShlB-type [Sphingomonas bacterium]|nr:ShlB/FhaC/HecB family hemolysin secretion/activation protein [Sphingomonas bacterium]MDB5690501.1 Polypeptide-transport-associated domain protein ShlB-type [Sphingomonas bacterium]